MTTFFIFLVSFQKSASGPVKNIQKNILQEKASLWMSSLIYCQVKTLHIYLLSTRTHQLTHFPYYRFPKDTELLTA